MHTQWGPTSGKKPGEIREARPSMPPQRPKGLLPMKLSGVADQVEELGAVAARIVAETGDGVLLHRRQRRLARITRAAEHHAE